jgi:hypothetical protein
MELQLSVSLLGVSLGVHARERNGQPLSHLHGLILRVPQLLVNGFCTLFLGACAPIYCFPPCS